MSSGPPLHPPGMAPAQPPAASVPGSALPTARPPAPYGQPAVPNPFAAALQTFAPAASGAFPAPIPGAGTTPSAPGAFAFPPLPPLPALPRLPSVEQAYLSPPMPSPLGPLGAPRAAPPFSSSYTGLPTPPSGPVPSAGLGGQPSQSLPLPPGPPSAHPAAGGPAVHIGFHPQPPASAASVISPPAPSSSQGPPGPVPGPSPVFPTALQPPRPPFTGPAPALAPPHGMPPGPAPAMQPAWPVPPQQSASAGFPQPVPGQQLPFPGQQLPLPGQQLPLPGQQLPLPGQQPMWPGQPQLSIPPSLAAPAPSAPQPGPPPALGPLPGQAGPPQPSQQQGPPPMHGGLPATAAVPGLAHPPAGLAQPGVPGLAQPPPAGPPQPGVLGPQPAMPGPQSAMPGPQPAAPGLPGPADAGAMDMAAVGAELPGARKRRVYATTAPPPLAAPSLAQTQSMEEGGGPAPSTPPGGYIPGRLSTRGSSSSLTGSLNGSFNGGLASVPDSPVPATPTTQAPPPFNIMAAKNVMPAAPLRPPRPNLPDTLRRRNCNPKFLRCTLNAIPESPALLSKSRLPFGLHVYPFSADPIPVLNSMEIMRCRACRAYINPFVTFLGQGRRWRCNLCLRVHDLPADFDYDPVRRVVVERSERPELMSASVEYIAPPDYTVRPPQACCYVLLIDVSAAAIAAGLPRLVCDTVLEQFDTINGDARTLAGIITYNGGLQFYRVKASQASPQMLVVSEVDEVVLPAPETDLLVNLKDSKDLFKSLLKSLPDLVGSLPASAQSCLGPALQAARDVIGTAGGRIMVFQAVLPDTGPGSLPSREDVKLRGTPKEYAQLNPETDWYKQFAVDVSRNQIAVDVHACPTGFIDLATLSHLARFSSGQAYYYPNFQAADPVSCARLRRDIARTLSRPAGMEAVMRVRATPGLSLAAFHGNFFVRTSDLLSVPAVTPDQGYAFQIAMDEKLPDGTAHVYFQVAVLFTTSAGERRIRVHTLAVPITADMPTIFANADGQAIAAFVAKMAVDKALSGSIDDARAAMANIVFDCLASFRANTTFSTSGALLVPEALRALPLMMCAMPKNPAFRVGTDISLDERAHAMNLLKSLPLWELVDYLYPRMYSLHDMAPNIGIRDELQRLPMPPLVQLAAERIDRAGIYLLINTQEMFLWVSRQAPPELVAAIFGTAPETVPDGPTVLPRLDTLQSAKVRAIVNGLRGLHPRHLPLHVVREDSPRRAAFMRLLMDDRQDPHVAYFEFVNRAVVAVVRP
eukprot:m.142096 g.142096  ORF g.142096 m.142096 type:complete len:1257 (-) comp9640_c0_seq5:1530-5300(-)